MTRACNDLKVLGLSHCQNSRKAASTCVSVYCKKFFFPPPHTVIRFLNELGVLLINELEEWSRDQKVIAITYHNRDIPITVLSRIIRPRPVGEILKGLISISPTENLFLGVSPHGSMRAAGWVWAQALSWRRGIWNWTHLDCMKGLGQGSPNSGNLFCAYIADLPEVLRGEIPSMNLYGTAITCLIFMDDLVIPLGSQQQVRDALQIVYKYSRKWAPSTVLQCYRPTFHMGLWAHPNPNGTLRDMPFSHLFGRPNVVWTL